MLLCDMLILIQSLWFLIFLPVLTRFNRVKKGSGLCIMNVWTRNMLKSSKQRMHRTRVSVLHSAATVSLVNRPADVGDIGPLGAKYSGWSLRPLGCCVFGTVAARHFVPCLGITYIGRWILRDQSQWPVDAREPKALAARFCIQSRLQW